MTVRPPSAPARGRLTAAALVALAGRVSGPTLTPGDEAYDAECSSFNVALTLRPSIVVGARSARDIQAAVLFATVHGLPVAVQSTGHGQATAADGAVLITTTRMSGVTVDPANRTARVEAGVRWQQMIADAAVHGLAPLSGSSPTVGVVGYTLGGGLSPTLGRVFGYAADHVLAIEVVTADGQLRTVTAEAEPDLFWALRGGQGNFGVVAAIQFKLFPVTRLFAGGMFFPGEDAAKVLHVWRELVADAPETLSSSVGLVRLPARPELPELIRGRFVAHARISYLGSAADGERVVAPLRGIETLLLDTVAEMPYSAVGAIHGDPTEPLPVYEASALLRDLPPEALDRIVEVAAADPTPPPLIEVRQMGGALSRDPQNANAVANREAEFHLFAAGVGEPGEAAGIRSRQADLLAAMAPWDTGRAFLNFLSFGDASAERVRTAYPEDVYRRLAAIKSVWDPAHTFRENHTIVPAAAEG